MADTPEKIEIQVTAEGTTEAAKELDGLTASLERQKKTQDMINATSADLQRRVRIDAIKAEAKEANTLGLALTNVQAAGVPANDVLQKVGFQFGNIRAASGAASALVGNLGRSFTTMVPAASTLVSGMQSAGMAMSQFLGLVGGGPGIVLGGVVAAVGFMATAFAKSSEEAERLAEQTKKNAEELKEYLKTIADLRGTIGSRFSAYAEKQKYEKDFGSGNLTSQQYAIERQYAKELYARKGELEGKRDAAFKSGDKATLDQMVALLVEVENAPARGERARGFESAAREREATLATIEKAKELADANAEEVAERKKAAEAAEKVLKEQQSKEDEARKAFASRGTSEGNAFLMGQGVDLAEKYAQESAAAIAAFEKKNTAEVESYNRRAKLMQQIEEDRQKHASDLEKARKAEEKAALEASDAAYRDSAMNIAQIGASSTLKMFSELTKGHEVAIGAVLEGIGDQMVAEGTRVLFQAAAMAFFPPTAPFAAGLAGVGAAEIAAGLALGAVGARGNGGSSYQGAGGGASSSPESQRINYADPFGNTARYGSTATGPMIVNVNFPTVLSPSAVDGARIRQATRKAMQVYG